MLKKKRQGVSLDIRTFDGQDGTRYVVFRLLDGSYHTFAEVEAKQAARECGAEIEEHTNQMWDKIWGSQE